MKIELTAVLTKNSEGVLGNSKSKRKTNKHNSQESKRIQVGVKTATMFKSLGVTVK